MYISIHVLKDFGVVTIKATRRVPRLKCFPKIVEHHVALILIWAMFTI